MFFYFINNNNNIQSTMIDSSRNATQQTEILQKHITNLQNLLPQSIDELRQLLINKSNHINSLSLPNDNREYVIELNNARTEIIKHYIVILYANDIYRMLISMQPREFITEEMRNFPDVNEKRCQKLLRAFEINTGNLPHEDKIAVLEHISEYLNADDLVRLTRVCKDTHKTDKIRLLLQQQSIWKKTLQERYATNCDNFIDFKSFYIFLRFIENNIQTKGLISQLLQSMYQTGYDEIPYNSTILLLNMRIMYTNAWLTVAQICTENSSYDIIHYINKLTQSFPSHNLFTTNDVTSMNWFQEMQDIKAKITSAITKAKSEKNTGSEFYILILTLFTHLHYRSIENRLTKPSAYLLEVYIREILQLFNIKPDNDTLIITVEAWFNKGFRSVALDCLFEAIENDYKITQNYTLQKVMICLLDAIITYDDSIPDSKGLLVFNTAIHYTIQRFFPILNLICFTTNEKSDEQIQIAQSYFQICLKLADKYTKGYDFFYIMEIATTQKNNIETCTQVLNSIVNLIINFHGNFAITKNELKLCYNFLMFYTIVYDGKTNSFNPDLANKLQTAKSLLGKQLGIKETKISLLQRELFNQSQHSDCTQSCFETITEPLQHNTISYKFFAAIVIDLLKRRVFNNDIAAKLCINLLQLIPEQIKVLSHFLNGDIIYMSLNAQNQQLTSDWLKQTQPNKYNADFFIFCCHASLRYLQENHQYDILIEHIQLFKNSEDFLKQKCSPEVHPKLCEIFIIIAETIIIYKIRILNSKTEQPYQTVRDYYLQAILYYEDAQRFASDAKTKNECAQKITDCHKQSRDYEERCKQKMANSHVRSPAIMYPSSQRTHEQRDSEKFDAKKNSTAQPSQRRY